MVWYEMSTHLNNNIVEVDDDFIDLKLLPSTNFFFYNKKVPSSLPQEEIEFQKSFPIPNYDRETTNCFADELFYKGKLLPLFLPPFKMVEKRHQNPTTSFQQDAVHFTNINYNSEYTKNNSPRNVSPQETCRISIDGFIALREFINNDHPKKTRSKNKLFKKSSIALKLKAYLKSLFSKSGRFVESQKKAAKENSRAWINDCPKIKRSSSSSCGSSSSSQSFSLISDGGYDEMQLLKKRNSTTTAHSEVDGSIEAAIAHCKKSYDELQTTNNDDEFLSYSVSRNADCSWELVRTGGLCSFS